MSYCITFDNEVLFMRTKGCRIKTNRFFLDLIVTCFRYDSTTGTFTVPPGADGFYYFSVFLIVDGDIDAAFDVEINGELICTVFSDLTSSSANNSETTTCSGVAYAFEGIRDKHFIHCSH